MAPQSSCSRTRLTARQQTPASVSPLEMGPLPTIDLATNRRMRVACVTGTSNPKFMSSRASGATSHAPLSLLCSGKCSLPSCQCAPTSSGVTNTGGRCRRRFGSVRTSNFLHLR